jgi:hypothetical protein
VFSIENCVSLLASIITYDFLSFFCGAAGAINTQKLGLISSLGALPLSNARAQPITKKEPFDFREKHLVRRSDPEI